MKCHRRLDFQTKSGRSKKGPAVREEKSNDECDTSGFVVEFKAPGGWGNALNGDFFGRASSSLYAKIGAVLYLKGFFAGFHLTSQQSTEPTSMTQLSGPLLRSLELNALK